MMLLLNLNDSGLMIQNHKLRQDYAYLTIKNKLPNENKRANFLAFSINTGIYRVESDMQKIPRPKHTKNPIIRCILD